MLAHGVLGVVPRLRRSLTRRAPRRSKAAGESDRRGSEAQTGTSVAYPRFRYTGAKQAAGASPHRPRREASRPFLGVPAPPEPRRGDTTPRNPGREPGDSASGKRAEPRRGGTIPRGRAHHAAGSETKSRDSLHVSSFPIRAGAEKNCAASPKLHFLFCAASPMLAHGVFGVVPRLRRSLPRRASRESKAIRGCARPPRGKATGARRRESQTGAGAKRRQGRPSRIRVSDTRERSKPRERLRIVRGAKPRALFSAFPRRRSLGEATQRQETPGVSPGTVRPENASSLGEAAQSRAGAQGDGSAAPYLRLT